MNNLNPDLSAIIERFDLNSDLLKTTNSSAEYARVRYNPQLLNRLEQDFNYPFSFRPTSLSTDLNFKILCAHFSPFSYEMESLGLPFYLANQFPCSTIHFSYDKGADPRYFSIEKNGYSSRLNKLFSKYDIIIGRSGVFRNMNERKHDRQVVRESSLKVNIKTMSYPPNMNTADHDFKENEFYPLADPSIREYASDNLLNKTNIIIMAGSVKTSKGQKRFFEQIDPELIKDYSIVIVGPIQDSNYANEITRLVKSKNIPNVFITGAVPQEFLFELFSISQIHVIPLDGRSLGQEEGYPRILAESLPFETFCVCSKTTTVPQPLESLCVSYDNDSNTSLNDAMESAFKMVSTRNEKDWSPILFEEMCDLTLKKCLDLLG